jgi:hypothetical protein
MLLPERPLKVSNCLSAHIFRGIFYRHLVLVDHRVVIPSNPTLESDCHDALVPSDAQIWHHLLRHGYQSPRKLSELASSCNLIIGLPGKHP